MTVDDLVFVGFNNKVFALNRGNGEVVWRWASPQLAGAPMILLDGDRVIAGLNGYLYCLDALSGAELWTNPMKGEGMGITALASTRGSTGLGPALAGLQASAHSA
jgi:outer membrane protein assembly factor BamB